VPSRTQPPYTSDRRGTQDCHLVLWPAWKSGLIYNVVRRWNAPADQRHPRYHFLHKLARAIVSLGLPPQEQTCPSRQHRQSYTFALWATLPIIVWLYGSGLLSLCQCQGCGAQPLQGDTSVGAPRGYKTSNRFCPETQQSWTILMANTNDLKTCSNLQFDSAINNSRRLVPVNIRASHPRHFISLAHETHMPPTVGFPAILHMDKSAIVSGGEYAAIYSGFPSDPASRIQPPVSRALLICA
jgi:hypothetical protein